MSEYQPCSKCGIHMLSGTVFLSSTLDTIYGQYDKKRHYTHFFTQCRKEKHRNSPHIIPVGNANQYPMWVIQQLAM